jgi:deaminated glutathione amidase
MTQLTLATCQFPVSGDIVANAGHIMRQMAEAHWEGAGLVHFSECSLSGYAGIHYGSTVAIDWELLRQQAERIMARAAELGVWVVLGSTHRLAGEHKPHNSLYVINDHGRLITRYDKLFCCGRGEPEPTEDLAHYSPGSQFITFDCRGVQVGMLICHDFRYPELYREYKRRKVDLMLHSYHNADMAQDKLAYYQKQVTFTMQAAAASNFLWISANNSSAPAAWPSFVVNPAGLVTGRLRHRRAGVLVTPIDTAADLWDASCYWRDQCLAGVLHSGVAVSDPRSDDRTTL